MDSFIPFLIIVFVIYRWGKKFNEFTKQNQGGNQKKTQSLQDFVESLSVEKSESPPVAQLPIERMLDGSESNELFQEDTWRRQLFVTAIIVGLGYLLYLLLI